jgi:predicted nucleic acid-binding protein
VIRIALDSNILLYAELEPESDKGRHAQRLITLCAPRGVLAVQTLLEFVTVVRRKRPQSLDSALVKARAWGGVFETAPTTWRIGESALRLMSENHFQLWDAVIWTSVREAGASVFFSEDLQDGFAKDGMRACNPFVRDAAALQAIVGA